MQERIRDLIKSLIKNSTLGHKCILLACVCLFVMVVHSLIIYRNAEKTTGVVVRVIEDCTRANQSGRCDSDLIVSYQDRGIEREASLSYWRSGGKRQYRSTSAGMPIELITVAGSPHRTTLAEDFWLHGWGFALLMLLLPFWPVYCVWWDQRRRARAASG
jgi:hypothetical protein